MKKDQSKILLDPPHSFLRIKDTKKDYHFSKINKSFLF